MVLPLNADATMAETLNVFLLLALPMEALKLPNVPITASSTISTTGDCSYALVTLTIDSSM